MFTYIKNALRGDPQGKLLKEIPIKEGQESLSADERIYAYVRKCVDVATTKQVELGQLARWGSDEFAKHKQLTPAYDSLPELAKKAITYLVSANPKLYFAVMVSHECSVKTLRATLASERLEVESLETQMDIQDLLHERAIRKALDVDNRQN